MVKATTGMAIFQLFDGQLARKQETSTRGWNNAQVANSVLQIIKGLKVLAKISSQECQGKEDDGRNGELLHRLVLVG
jgi:hypothetical protein